MVMGVAFAFLSSVSATEVLGVSTIHSFTSVSALQDMDGPHAMRAANLFGCCNRALVKALNDVELIAVTGGRPKVVLFGFDDQKKWYVVFFFCWFIVNHGVCRRHTTLQIGTTHEDTVRCQICCLSRASGLVVVGSGPSMHGLSGVPIGELLVVLQQWLLVASVRSTFLVGCGRLRCSLQCHLKCLASKLFHRNIQRTTAASYAHVSCSGGREPVAWVQMQFQGNRHFLVFSEQAHAAVIHR